MIPLRGLSKRIFIFKTRNRTGTEISPRKRRKGRSGAPPGLPSACCPQPPRPSCGQGRGRGPGTGGDRAPPSGPTHLSSLRQPPPAPGRGPAAKRGRPGAAGGRRAGPGRAGQEEAGQGRDPRASRCGATAAPSQDGGPAQCCRPLPGRSRPTSGVNGRHVRAAGCPQHLPPAPSWRP